MTMTELANLIQALESLGWTGDQITALQLAIEGRISLEDMANRIKKAAKEKDSKE